MEATPAEQFSQATQAPSGQLKVIGGGLAGSEAAWQAAERGVEVILYEMRPTRPTPAHVSDQLAELVCSNSLGSERLDRAAGLLKEELRRMGSLVTAAAAATAVPAGHALAVDREAFARWVTAAIERHPRIALVREEVTAVPTSAAVVATGPLTGDALAADLARLTGREHLHFYDALAPIVTAESVDMSVAFRQSRYGRGETEAGDYINCPFTAGEYDMFVHELLAAERIELRDFEREDEAFFEGCLPIEVLAGRNSDALAFGPLRPVGLRDPRSGRRPHAVVQLRPDNAAGSLHNLVGFQTNIRWPEQQRILRLIPGLERAEFVRLGQMHRNTFLNAPALLRPTLQFRERAELFFAGQITGIEGYVGSAASGLLAGVNAARFLGGLEPLTLPDTTMLGALCRYITQADSSAFQPMKANFGLLPPLSPPVKQKGARYLAYGQRALADLASCMAEAGWEEAQPGARMAV